MKSTQNGLLANHEHANTANPRARQHCPKAQTNAAATSTNVIEKLPAKLKKMAALVKSRAGVIGALRQRLTPVSWVSRNDLPRASNNLVNPFQAQHRPNARCYGSIYEPDYLDALRPQHPTYERLNVQMKSYDFTIVEHFGGYVHRALERLGLDVADSWATPAQIFRVQTYKPQSTIVNKEYKLSLYERNVQISDMPAYLSPIVFELLRAALPEGLQLSVHPHEGEHDEIRYIPDLDLIDLKNQLEALQNPNVKGKKK